MQSVNEMQTRLNELTAKISAMHASIADGADITYVKNAMSEYGELLKEAGELKAQIAASTPAPIKTEIKEEKNMELKDILASREYAVAFADALRTGCTPSRDYRASEHEVLYKALTELGGTPTGSEGGFLVPEDVNTMINEKVRALDPLSAHFSVETVTSNSGWRVMDTAPTTGFTKVANELANIAADDAPKFVKVPFSLDTYGLYIPVSNELAMDETANLFGYLSDWFAKKQVITENKLLLGTLPTIANCTSIASDPLKGLKTALNKTLDPAISKAAKIICNQDAFQALDELVDQNGRPLLQPDPVNATMYRMMGREVIVVPNTYLPTATNSPIYVGDFSQFAKLFVRQPLEITSTDVGGNAFRTNSIEVRGITRMCVATFDAAAVAGLKV